MSTEITRIFDFAYYQLDNYNLPRALVSKTSGQWVATSSKEFIAKANIVSRGLLALGVKPGDKIALISTSNRTEWNIMDLALLQIGAVNVPIYPTISFHEGRPWGVACDIAFPCATQNEINREDAEALVKNGCMGVSEGVRKITETKSRFHVIDNTET